MDFFDIPENVMKFQKRIGFYKQLVCCKIEDPFAKAPCLSLMVTSIYYKRVSIYYSKI